MVLDEVFEHVLNKIEKAKIVTDPYPHFFLEEIFPSDFYQQLQKMFPKKTMMKPIGTSGKVSQGAYPQRYLINLHKNDLFRLDSLDFLFWTQFSKGILDPAFIDRLTKRFEPYLQDRYAEDFDKITFSAMGELYLDIKNYAIGPHTDHPFRALTFLFYLPSDENLKSLGTSVYKPKDPDFKCSGINHHGFGGFEKVFTAPFKPNSLFGFVKSDISFHGVERIHEAHIERKLLNYIVYGKKRP
jgi:hypothetical protein